MQTIVYFDKDTAAEADDLVLTATSMFGVQPIKVEVGKDITLQELESVLVVDMRRSSFPLIAHAETDRLVSLEG